MTFKASPVKFVEGTDDTLSILAAPYGGPFIGKNGEGSDLDGERFTKDTDFCLSWFPNDRPLLFDHGHDEEVKVDPVGRLDGKSMKRTDAGLWATAVLDRNDQYFSVIHDLVSKGKLYASSGAMGHLVERDKMGNITRWPLVEVSLTPTPSNLLAQVGFDTVAKHYKSAHIDFDILDEADDFLKSVKAVMDFGCSCPHCRCEVKADLTTDERNSLSDGDFAYIDSEGGRHLPVQDKAHVSNAISRFGATNFESEAKKKAAAKKIMARAKKFGIEVSEDSAVAKASKAFFELLVAAAASDDEDLKTHIKTLMESVDTSGGFLVPEQHVSGAVQKKGTDDATEDEDKKKKKTTTEDKSADPLEALRIELSADPTKLAAFLTSLLTNNTETPDADPAADKNAIAALAVPHKGQMVVLSDRKSVIDEAKAGEIVSAGGFNYYDPPEGSVEDWLCDLRCLINKGMFGPFGYAGYADVIATYGVNGPGFAIVCLYTYDEDGRDEAFYRVDFDVDEQGEPVLKEATPYSAVYVPTDSLPGNTVGDDDDDAMEKSVVPLVLHADFTNMVIRTFSARTKGVSQRRLKEGRVLSTSNRERIGKLIATVKSSLDDLQDLLDSTVPPVKAGSDVLRRKLEVLEMEFNAQQLMGGNN